MATTPQQFIQPTAQAAVPSAVNNGNPNTVYNTPWQTQFNTLYPNQQAIPPMTTATGQWFLPQTQAAPAPNWQPPSALTVNRAAIQWPTPVFPQGTGTGGTPTGPVTGGNQQPTVPTNSQGGGSFNPRDFTVDGNTGITGAGANDPNHPFNWFTREMGGAMGARGSADYQKNVSLYNNVVSSLGGMKDAQGNWDWRQIVDMVTEPLLGADIWLSGSKKWDASNGIAAVIQTLTGLPINNIMNKLGEWQATQDDPADSWLEKMLADHWEDNGNNQIDLFRQALTGYMGDVANQQVSAINNNTSTYNQAWTNNYTNAMADAMLKGMTGQQARDYAKQQANQQTQGTAGGTTGGGAHQAGSYDGRTGTGIEAVDTGCVVVDNIIEGYEYALDVQVGDSMIVIDAKTFERRQATVSQSETIRRACVRIETKHGVVLECSTDAEIADENGDRILAKNLLGVAVPSIIDGEKVDDIVMKVEDIGTHPVQKITCENSWYLAGKERGKYLLHHNVKFFNEYGNRTTASGWQGSGSIAPNGLRWGW